MCTSDDLHSTSDELLKCCSISAGQIVRIRKGLEELDTKKSQCNTVNVGNTVYKEHSEIVISTLPLVEQPCIIAEQEEEICIFEHVPSEQLSRPLLPAFKMEVHVTNDYWLNTFVLPKQVRIRICKYNQMTKKVLFIHTVEKPWEFQGGLEALEFPREMGL